MDISEREDHPSSATEDDGDYKKVSKRIAGVSLESDSLPESSEQHAQERIARRKKRGKRSSRGHQMDVDQPQKSPKQSKFMECDDVESHISSSDDEDQSEDNRGREADDEQSDWVDAPADADGELMQIDRRQPARRSATLYMAKIQRRLEKFSMDPTRNELGIDLRHRERPNPIFNRLLYKYKLEVVRRHRTTVFVKKVADVTAR